MTFVDLTDFSILIQPQQLTQLAGSGSTQLDLAVEIAMAEAKTYLIQKYDIDAEYAKTGTSRDLQLRMAVVDITLYILHSRISPNNVPELRKDRYDNTIMWLKDCARGRVTPALEIIDITTTGARIRFSYDPKQPNKY